MEKFLELTKKYMMELYNNYGVDSYILCTEEGKEAFKVPVTALSAVLVAAKELKYNGYIYFTEKMEGIQNFHLAIDFKDGVGYYSRFSWGWQRRIPARNLALNLKIAS